MFQRLLNSAVLAILVCVSAVSVMAQETTAWKVGDQVDGWNVSWYPGVVKEVGTGTHAGSYLVKFDKFSTDQWVEAKNVRARKPDPAPVPAKVWHVGDKIEGWNVAWYEGVVKEIGSGKYQGHYLVKWDKYDTDQWVEAKGVRARRDPAAEAKKVAKLSLAMGKYQCAVFLDGKYTRTSSTFTLKANATYETSFGQGGKYEHDKAGQRVKFVGGALEDSFGRVEAETDQERLIIRLNKNKDSSESEYTQNWKAQYCTPVK